MDTLDCTDIKALLSPYLDDELDTDTRHLAERHLSECESCRALVDETERLDGLLAAVSQRDADGSALSPQFIGGVMSRTVYAEPVRHTGIRGWIMWAGWSAAAASLVFAAVLWMNERQQVIEFASTIGGALSEEFSGGVIDDFAPHKASAIRTAAYETGATLRSLTFDGALPAQAFHASLVEPVDHYEPVFGSVRRGYEELGSSFDAPERPDELLAAGEPAVADQPAEPVLPLPRPAIARDDAETFYATSLVLEALADAGLHSFADVERVRRIAEFDELLPRLRAARDRVDAQDRTAVLAAESLLTRVVHGPLNREDVQILRDTVAQLELTKEMGKMSLRWEHPSS